MIIKTPEALDNFEVFSGKTPANPSVSIIVSLREANWLPGGGPSLSTICVIAKTKVATVNWPP